MDFKVFFSFLFLALAVSLFPFWLPFLSCPLPSLRRDWRGSLIHLPVYALFFLANVEHVTDVRTKPSVQRSIVDIETGRPSSFNVNAHWCVGSEKATLVFMVSRTTAENIVIHSFRAVIPGFSFATVACLDLQPSLTSQRSAPPAGQTPSVVNQKSFRFCSGGQNKTGLWEKRNLKNVFFVSDVTLWI